MAKTQFLLVDFNFWLLTNIFKNSLFNKLVQQLCKICCSFQGALLYEKQINNAKDYTGGPIYLWNRKTTVKLKFDILRSTLKTKFLHCIHVFRLLVKLYLLLNNIENIKDYWNVEGVLLIHNYFGSAICIISSLYFQSVKSKTLRVNV